MKKLIPILLIALVLPYVGSSQDERLSKVKTLDSTIETLYGVISGEAGEKRDWELFKYLFTADAQLIPTVIREGKPSYISWTPDIYIQNAGVRIEESGFFEKEINRVTESFGSVTHVFSTYESYRTAKDEEPFTRGINSIQFMNDGSRWWIVNIYWTAESGDNPIPKKYLPK
ncbi:MAG: hypothetical protein ABJP45_04890 [Cyclobacteriaceae bacterium]